MSKTKLNLSDTEAISVKRGGTAVWLYHGDVYKCDRGRDYTKSDLSGTMHTDYSIECYGGACKEMFEYTILRVGNR